MPRVGEGVGETPSVVHSMADAAKDSCGSVPRLRAARRGIWSRVAAAADESAKGQFARGGGGEKWR